MPEDLEKTPNTFAQDFYQFIITRQDAAAASMAYRDKEHNESLKEHGKLSKQIQEKVGFELFNQYAALTSRINVAEHDAIYLQGFLDAQKMRDADINLFFMGRAN